MVLPSKYIILIHIIGWLFFLLLPVAFVSTQGLQWQNVLQILPKAVVYFSIYPLVFYLHTYWLFPKLYMRKKYGWYAVMLLILATTIIFIRPFDRTLAGIQHPESMFRKPPARQQTQGIQENDFKAPVPSTINEQPTHFNPRSFAPPGRHKRLNPVVDIVSILFFLLTIGLSITVQATRRWRQAVQVAAQAETDRVNAELSFLKAQINPHFLFNTLNNIYSLALTKDDHTADSIMKLSNIMRYVTDDATSNFVALESEAQCIADYIDLQRLRMSKKTTIDLSIQGITATQNIAPLVLMTFVENAFKYGVSSHEPSVIDIQLQAHENGIRFFCQNPIFPSKEKIESTGIGIRNTQKRLASLYPNRHLLKIDQANGFFTVNLTLQ